MKNKEVIEKYGIRKKMGIAIVSQVAFIIVALVLTIIGIIKSTDSINRLIIYIGQSIACISIIVFGLVNFKKRDANHFKVVINAYAMLEALRAALLVTDGIKPFPAFLARFLLTILACNCVLFAERLGDKKNNHIVYRLLFLEIVLYIVFLFGFPAVGQRLLFTILPFVGILIAGSLCLFQKARNEQLNNISSK